MNIVQPTANQKQTIKTHTNKTTQKIERKRKKKQLQKNKTITKDKNKTKQNKTKTSPTRLLRNLLMLVDFEKAFDTVEWPFIKNKTLNVMALAQHFVNGSNLLKQIYPVLQ